MKPREISDLIKENLSADGSLYLTCSKASQLIRWLELTEKLWREQEMRVLELQDILKPYINRETDL